MAFKVPKWDENKTNSIEPAVGLQTDGFKFADALPAATFNWLHRQNGLNWAGVERALIEGGVKIVSGISSGIGDDVAQFSIPSVLSGLDGFYPKSTTPVGYTLRRASGAHIQVAIQAGGLGSLLGTFGFLRTTTAAIGSDGRVFVTYKSGSGDRLFRFNQDDPRFSSPGGLPVIVVTPSVSVNLFGGYNHFTGVAYAPSASVANDLDYFNPGSLTPNGSVDVTGYYVSNNNHSFCSPSGTGFIDEARAGLNRESFFWVSADQTVTEHALNLPSPIGATPAMRSISWDEEAGLWVVVTINSDAGDGDGEGDGFVRVATSPSVIPNSNWTVTSIESGFGVSKSDIIHRVQVFCSAGRRWLATWRGGLVHVSLIEGGSIRRVSTGTWGGTPSQAPVYVRNGHAALCGFNGAVLIPTF